MTRTSRLLGALAVSMFTAGFIVVVTMLSFIVGPFLEGRLFPVLVDMRAIVIEQDQARMVIQLIGRKARSCDSPIDTGAVVFATTDWVIATVAPEVPRGLSPSARPEGLQTFRRLVVTPPGQALRLSFAYRCHPLWETRFTLPDLPLTPPAR